MCDSERILLCMVAKANGPIKPTVTHKQKNKKSYKKKKIV